eukprot:jgi/Mesen1/2280/ME000154S01447
MASVLQLSAAAALAAPAHSLPTKHSLSSAGSIARLSGKRAFRSLSVGQNVSLSRQQQVMSYRPVGVVRCSAAEGSVTAASSANWVPAIPLEALPKGERRLVRQDGETILMLWFRNEIYAIESISPAEGAYAEGFLNAKLTQDGSIVCPTTSTTFDLKTGAIKEWYPNNPVLRLLTRPLRNMIVYPVKVEDGQIYVDLQSLGQSQGQAEVVFGGDTRVGQTATDVAVDETRMVVDDTEEGFGFTLKNELVNGRAAMMGFAALLVIEAVTGKGLLAATGFLNFLYSYLTDFPIIRY